MKVLDNMDVICARLESKRVLYIQKTATKAVVKVAMNQSIGDAGFQLLVLLAELHVPRMWVEQHPDHKDSRVKQVLK